MKINKELILSILIGIIGIIFTIIMIIYVYIQFFNTPLHTIQDVMMWCCNNINETISPTGDNCSKVINTIYGGKC